VPGTKTQVERETVERLRMALGITSRYLRSTEAGEGLTPTELSILATITRRGSLRLTELAEIERVNPTMLSRIAGRLAEAQLISRQADADDRRVARVEATPAWFIGEWPRAIEAAREIARSGVPLSMVRLSTPIETATTLALAGDGRTVRALRGYLRLRRIGPEPCLLLVAASGDERIVETAVREVGSIVRRHGGFGVGGGPGRQWRRNRFRVPDLREALWELGYAVDTLETAVAWSGVPDLAAELGRTLRHGLDDVGEHVHAFSHVSHVYPSGSSLYTTFVFRTAADPDDTLERWLRLKRAASDTIVRHGATISHQHGVGRDHRPWITAEKGDLGVELLRAVAQRLDPDGVMNPGILLPELVGDAVR
jgi:alkyldihydroxyacetonephosphate synthase